MNYRCKLKNLRSELNGRKSKSRFGSNSVSNLHSTSSFKENPKFTSRSSFKLKLPQITQKKKRGDGSHKYIKKHIPSVRTQKYIADTERLCRRIEREMEEDEMKVMDMLGLMKNNEGMRKNIKELNVSLNKIIERRRMENVLNKKAVRRKRPPPNPILVYTKLMSNNET